MSESSIDKTKRKFCAAFNSYNIRYQYSFFFTEGISPDDFLVQLKKFKITIRRKYNTPILVKLNLSFKRELHAYITLYTEIELDDFKEYIESRFTGKSKSRKLTEEKKTTTLASIKKQKPHNLNKYFGKNKINRYAVLGRSRETPKTTINQN